MKGLSKCDDIIIEIFIPGPDMDGKYGRELGNWTFK